MYKKLLLCMIAIAASSNVVYGSTNPGLIIGSALLQGAANGWINGVVFSLPCLMNAITPVVNDRSYAIEVNTPLLNNIVNSYIFPSATVGALLGAAVSLASLVFPARVPQHFKEHPRFRSSSDESIHGYYLAKRGGDVAGIAGNLTALLAVGCCYMGITVEDIRQALGR